MTLSFIETHFPEAELSAECCKERRSNHGQRLTGLGKWWGRKPLALSRALLLGMLMPSSGDPLRDREVFLQLMSMDESALLARRRGIPLKVAARFLSESEGDEYLASGDTDSPRLRNPTDRERVELLAFARMDFETKLRHCARLEEMEGPTASSWHHINAHLGTSATDLAEFIEEISRRRFGRRVRVGDGFCGGGGLVFEAARHGADVVASDANPVAALLTWGALNVLGGGREVCSAIGEAQSQILAKVRAKIDGLGAELDRDGRRGGVYFYCSEVRCTGCGWMVPLTTSWVLGERTRSIVKLVPDESNRLFTFEVLNNAREEEVQSAKRGTVHKTAMSCPHCGTVESLTNRRRNEPPQLWRGDQITPASGDLFQERLYAVKWTRPDGTRVYAAPDEGVLRQEALVTEYVAKHLSAWQAEGFVPSAPIPRGSETSRLSSEHGWNQWHQLYQPRQLFNHALIAEAAFGSDAPDTPQAVRAGLLLWLGMIANRDCKLAGWVPSWGVENTDQVFTNNALNTRFNRAARGSGGFDSMMNLKPPGERFAALHDVQCRRCETIEESADLWITDPPFGDAVAYGELSGFFHSAYDKLLPKLFPDWPTELPDLGDSSFREMLSRCYERLARRMPPDGMQAILFAHPGRAIWADLAAIIRSARLRVTACWCVATESSSSIRKGRRLDGTVVLILRHAVECEPVGEGELAARLGGEITSRLRGLAGSASANYRKLLESDGLGYAWPLALKLLTNEGSAVSADWLLTEAEKTVSEFLRNLPVSENVDPE